MISRGFPPHQANSAFLTLTHLLQHLGLLSNDKKVEPPSHRIVCLSNEINAKMGTQAIPLDKLKKLQGPGTKYKDW